jgi:hypothetical protein
MVQTWGFWYKRCVQLQLRHQSEREVCATWGPIVIRICDGLRTEIDDLRRVELLFDELLETHTNTGMLLVFTQGTPMPDGATQRYAGNSMNNYGDRMVLSVAMLGLGFWASAVRAAFGTLARIARRHMWIEGSVEQAVARLCMDLVGPDPDALMAVYRELWDVLAPSTRKVG